MDEPLLAAFAKDASGVAMPIERIAAHAPNVNRINRLVADAALERLGIDRPPLTFDSFRASYADASEAGGA